MRTAGLRACRKLLNCGGSARLSLSNLLQPNSLVTQLAVTGGTFIFSTGDAGSPDNPRWCPEPAGTPCETMGAFQSGASNDTYYVRGAGSTTAVHAGLKSLSTSS